MENQVLFSRNGENGQQLSVKFPIMDSMNLIVMEAI